jgi:hypothetical protein
MAIVCAVAVRALGGAAAAGQEAEPPPRDTVRTYTLQPVPVEGRADDLTRVAVSASQGRIGAIDLRRRALVREGELLEAVPGMILTQHSGDGKANQIFVRGFNLDHGTDFRTTVEGMPVNLPTHGHGHGYTDLNFLIPELVDYVEYRLGVYYPEIGDFGSAGGADVRLATARPRPLVALQAGTDRFARAVGAGSLAAGPGTLLLGGEVKAYDGPWLVAQELRKLSAAARYTQAWAGGELSVLALAYRNRWNASGQIPRRAITAGTVDRFGQVDSTLGGRSSRYSLSTAWSRAGAASAARVEVYGIVYALDLFSNFTYALDQPVAGDQLEQVDDRVVAGVNAELLRAARLAGRDHGLRIGVQARYDDIDVALHRSTARARYATVRADAVGQWAGSAYAAAESWWAARFRTVLGVRGDVYSFSVQSDRAENSGERSAGLLTPKASVIVGPWGGTEVYLGAGLGFHSNDARGTTIQVDPATGLPVEPVKPLVRSRGAEAGVRAAPLRGLRSTFVAWWLDLDSELLFAGDAGTTEPSAQSRRIGVTWTNFWRATPALTLDLDVSLTNARFPDAPPGADRVPGALENVIAAGLAWESPRNGPFAALRMRHFGAYPLSEDNQQRGAPTTLVNLTAGWSLGAWRATASLFNLFDAQDADIQYYYASRLPGETLAGVEDIHLHPVEPRQLRVAIAWGY